MNINLYKLATIAKYTEFQTSPKSEHRDHLHINTLFLEHSQPIYSDMLKSTYISFYINSLGPLASDLPFNNVFENTSWMAIASI